MEIEVPAFELPSSTMELEHYPYADLDLKKKKSNTDRFIPLRTVVQNNSYLMAFDKPKPGPAATTAAHEEENYDKLISQNLLRLVSGPQPSSDQNTVPRLLKFNQKTKDSFCAPTQESLYDVLVRKNSNQDKTSARVISPVPEKILDAPDLKDDYYLNLMDWSSCGPLTIGLDNKVYLYTPRQISELCSFEQEYVCSVAFHPHNPLLSIGDSSGNLHIYDIDKETKIRSIRSHIDRATSLAFSSVLFSGSKDSSIMAHDLKMPNSQVFRLSGHRGEVCGLKFDACGLASGSNDNLAIIWDINMRRPRFTLEGHKAAVKALAWCPWQRNLLATGGGTTDKTMRFWDIDNGKLIRTVNTQSQVCSLIWNRDDKEILSSHGYSDNQLCLWKYPQATKITQLKGHTKRVLHMALSPDGTTVCSASADETLRFWRVFPGQPQSHEDKKLEMSQFGFCSLR